MHIVKLMNGEEVRGTVVEEKDEELILGVGPGMKLVVEQARVISSTKILDCTQARVGQFIETPQGVYIKIDPGTFRLVKGPYTSQIDLRSIQDGRYVTYEEVFPEFFGSEETLSADIE